MKTLGQILALSIIGALLLLAFDAGAQTLGETRTLCQTAHSRRFPKDAGPDDAGELYEWDRLQSILDDAREDCQVFIAARADFLGNAATTHTIQELKDLLLTCNDSVALVEAAKAILAADKAACAAASISLSCANSMGYPGECPTDGGS